MASEPQDVVAIFHASFHPIKGNIIDRYETASDDLDLHGLEFSALPSGLHLVEQDVVYFTKDDHHGVCVFRRRRTSETGHRGFRLSSLGILLAKSTRPRPWRHLSSLKDLIGTLYSSIQDNEVLDITDSTWAPARRWYDAHKVRRADLGGAGDWKGWSQEFESTHPLDPTLHLSHLLRILGPSVLTLYKHVIGRQRILIYTLPPVEAAAILCHVAADMCLEAQLEDDSPGSRLKGRSKQGIKVLGMITLSDLERMRRDGETNRGWVACTTDAIFLEKPSEYDLFIDLTTSTPHKATRPTMHVSRPIPEPTKGQTHRLSTVRFAWSDVRMWNELDRILQLDADQCEHGCCGELGGAKSPKFVATWTDAWRVYEDVCIICAGLWMNGSWKHNSKESYRGSMADWGKPRLEGDDDLTVGSTFIRNLGNGIEGRPEHERKKSRVSEDEGTSYVRTLGNGIEGRRPTSPAIENIPSSPTSSKIRRASGMSWSSGRAATVVEQDPATDRWDRQVMTTLALLQTFHASTCFQLSRLQSFLPSDNIPQEIELSAKDVLSFELGPLSSLDARYLHWLAEEYAGGHTVVVRRGWRDLFGMVLGL